MIQRFVGEYRFLSNFWPCRIESGGRVFPSVEHAYQAAKFREESIIAAIQAAPTPGQAKRLGRTAQHAVDPTWPTRRVAVMRALVRQKFQDPALARRLLATGEHELAEGNTWGDRFWGVDLGSGQGANTLGRILMEIRAELRGGSARCPDRPATCEYPGGAHPHGMKEVR